MAKWYVLNFVHQKYQCIGSQGNRPWLWPSLTPSLVVMGQKGSSWWKPQTTVALDVTSNASY